MTGSASLAIVQDGRRLYVAGNSYAVKDRLKGVGCKWDRDRRQWWIGSGKRSELDAVVGQVDAAPVSGSPDNSADGDGQIVAGRAQYKGRTYYLAGRVNRGATRWERDTVSAVETRDGAKVLLVFRDGSKKFWAEHSAVRIAKSYRSPQTIGSLRDFADRAKSDEPRCGECGGFGELVADLEDGMLKHPRCCDIPPSGY